MHLGTLFTGVGQLKIKSRAGITDKMIGTSSRYNVKTEPPWHVQHYSDVIMSTTHQPHDCLLNHLFRRRSKKTSKPRVNSLCAGNSPVTGEFPAQRASNAENISIWWRHHENCLPIALSESSLKKDKSLKIPIMNSWIRREVIPCWALATPLSALPGLFIIERCTISRYDISTAVFALSCYDWRHAIYHP